MRSVFFRRRFRRKRFIAQSSFGIHIDFLRGVQGAFFLRKKALSSVLSVDTNSKTAIAPRVYYCVESQAALSLPVIPF